MPTLINSAYKFNGVPTTAEQTIDWAKSLQVKYPGLFFLIEAILGEDEKVALRWRMNGHRKMQAKQRGLHAMVLACPPPPTLPVQAQMSTSESTLPISTLAGTERSDQTHRCTTAK